MSCLGKRTLRRMHRMSFKRSIHGQFWMSIMLIDIHDWLCIPMIYNDWLTNFFEWWKSNMFEFLLSVKMVDIHQCSCIYLNIGWTVKKFSAFKLSCLPKQLILVVSVLYALKLPIRRNPLGPYNFSVLIVFPYWRDLKKKLNEIKDYLFLASIHNTILLTIKNDLIYPILWSNL